MPNDRPAAITAATLAAITAGYLECAAWADAPEGSAARFTAAARRQAAAVCAAFVEYIGPELAAQALAVPGYGPARFGHDFWLTRCGHGAGFWDRDALAVPPGPLPVMPDRNGKPADLTHDRDTLGRALSAAAYGTRAHISPFAYPSLIAYRGWLSFDDRHASRPVTPARPLHGRIASI